MSAASLAARATEAAVLASGRTTQLSTTLLDPNDNVVQLPNPWARPSPDDAGFATQNTMAVDVRVSFHQNSQARRVWLLVDRDNLPLTGDFVVEVDGTTVTYDATAAAPADKDTLLEEWADAINNNVTVGAIVTATRVKLRDASGSYDAVRLEAIPAAADAADGIPAGAAYATYSIGADIAAPQAAALRLVREVDSASMSIWTLKGFTVASTVQAGLNTAMSGLIDAWVETLDFGALNENGFDERLDYASRNAGFVHLYDPVTTDEPLSIAVSGDGLYGVINKVLVAMAPATAS